MVQAILGDQGKCAARIRRHGERGRACCGTRPVDGVREVPRAGPGDLRVKYALRSAAVGAFGGPASAIGDGHHYHFTRAFAETLIIDSGVWDASNFHLYRGSLRTRIVGRVRDADGTGRCIRRGQLAICRQAVGTSSRPASAVQIVGR